MKEVKNYIFTSEDYELLISTDGTSFEREVSLMNIQKQILSNKIEKI